MVGKRCGSAKYLGILRGEGKFETVRLGWLRRSTCLQEGDVKSEFRAVAWGPSRTDLESKRKVPG